MEAIVVTDEAAGTAGMTLAERPEPEAAFNPTERAERSSEFVHNDPETTRTPSRRSGAGEDCDREVVG